MRNKERNQSLLFHIALLAGLFLPTNNISYIIQGVLPFVLYVYYRPVHSLNIKRYSLFIIIIMIISFILNLLINNVSNSGTLRLISFILLFGLFPFTKPIKISNVIIYISLVYIILSQVAYVLGINSLISYFDSLYPYTGDKLGYQTEFLLRSAGDIESIVNRRYGGLYHNPNQCVRYVTLLLVVFLINSKEKIKLIKKIFFIALVYISVLLSGSRTGLVVVTFIVLYDLFRYNKVKFNFKFVSLSFVTLFFLAVFFFVLSDSGFRVFLVTEGNFNSLEAKFSYFFQYIDQLFSPLIFVLGNFSSDNIYIIYGLSQLDSEWGELFYSFGLFGLISFAMFYFKLWKTKNEKLRFYMVILLWGITSTIIFSFRMSFIFMLLLSNYYSEYKLSSQHMYEKSN